MAVAVAVVLVSACGGSRGSNLGSSSPSTSKQSMSSTSSTSKQSTSSTSSTNAAEANAWVDAAASGVLNDPDRPKTLTPTAARCLAHALIDTLTVARLKGAGTTLAELRDPNGHLPTRLGTSTPTAVKIALGAALQKCRLGDLFAGEFVKSFAESMTTGYQPDASSTGCVAVWVQGSTRRELLADLVLHGVLSENDDEALVDLMLECFDFAKMIGPSMHLTFSSSERVCINDAARNDPELRAALAAEIKGGERATDVFAGFGVRLVRCLTPAHLAELRMREQPSGA